MRKIFILLLGHLLFCGLLQAQNRATVLSELELLEATTMLVTGGSVDLPVHKISPAQPLRQERRSAQLWYSLDTGEDHLTFAGADFTVNIPFYIWKLDDAGNPIGGSWIKADTLRISAAQPERLKIFSFIDELNVDPAFQNIRLELSNNPDIQIGGGSPPGLAAYLDAHLRLKVRTDIRFAVDVRQAATMTLADAPIVSPKNTTTLTNRVQTFKWTTDGKAFPNYELQILRLYNRDGSLATDQDAINTTVDWQRALRVETQSADTIFTLTVAEGTGFYLWRVRPIGTYFSGGIANSENYGPWSSALASGSPVYLNRNSISLPEAFYFEDPDQDLNWIYNRVFTEGDGEQQSTRASEGISYADALLNLRQSQVYNSAQADVLISQSIPDYSGRPAFNTLPVPVSGNMDLGYRLGFVQNELGDLYTSADFDTLLYAPDTIYTVGTDFAYYSDENLDVTIPNAEGYAFKRTLFKTDGTGRVAEESGVGRVHALGSQVDGQGRTTRILYGNPSDDELIRIFGEEAEKAETVTKTITIDPNNVASITYTSVTQGQVIATALATIDTDNLEALSGTVSPLVIHDTIEQNFWTNRAFVSYKRLALPYLADVTLNYERDCSGSWGCLGGDCDYSVQFCLVDIQRQHVYQSQILPVGCGPLDLSGLNWTAMTANAPPLNAGSTITLKEGEYLISKKLMDKLPIDFASQSTTDAFAETQQLIDAIAALMQDVDNADEYSQFASDMVLLEGYLVNGNDAAVIQLLGLPADFVIPIDFSFTFDPTSGSPDPAQLTFEPACCPTSSLTIVKPEKCQVCEYAEVERVANDGSAIQDTVYKYFITEVLDAHLLREGFTLNYFDTVAPGFTRESMAFMLSNMISAQYHTGNSMMDPGGSGQRVKAKHDSDGYLTPETPVTYMDVDNDWNYDCKRLYECWTSCVSMIGNFTLGDSINVMDDFNERQGSGSSEDHYDDDEVTDFSGLGGAILSFIISRKMRKFNNSEEGIIRPSRMGSILSLPNLFWECSGYEFAAILDGAITAPNEYLSSNVTLPANTATASLSSINVNTSDHGNRAPVIYDFEGGSIPQPERLQHPFITKPEWGWKYFVYNVANDGYITDVVTPLDDSYSYLLPDQLPIEINSCYNPPNCTNGLDLCFNPCRYYHENWSSGQRLNFYKQIRYAPADPEFRNLMDSVFVDGDLPECPPQDTLNEQAIAQIDAIEASLSTQVWVFRSRIEQMLLDSCYVIVDCVPGPGEVSNQQINLMVQGVIGEIQQKLQLVRDNVGTVTDGVLYPYCETKDCNWINSNYACEEKREVLITYFAPCDQLILNQIEYWNFLPYGVQTQCSPSQGGPDLTENQYDGTNCDQDKEYSETYNVTNASLSGGNQ